jgi:hypothetical protein
MTRKISLEETRALRSLRSGASLDVASRRWGVQREVLGKLADSYRNVPDEFLEHLEFVLSDREKLRRLVADLVPPLRQ